MKKIERYLPYCLFTILVIVLHSCGEPNGMYVDIKKGAIVTCTGHGFKDLLIESDSTSVELEGTSSAVYFNKKNSARTMIKDSIVFEYFLKLKPNMTYTATSRIGGDQGPNRVLFKTDKSGKVVSASDSSCSR